MAQSYNFWRDELTCSSNFEFIFLPTFSDTHTFFTFIMFIRFPPLYDNYSDIQRKPRMALQDFLHYCFIICNIMY